MDPTKRHEFCIEVDFDDSLLADIAIDMAKDFGITLEKDAAYSLVQDELEKLIPLVERMQDAIQVSFRDQLFRHMLEATKEGGL